MCKKAVQQGHSKRRGESYSVPYGEPLRAARTPLAAFSRILLGEIDDSTAKIDKPPVIYLLHIMLLKINPPIWRRMLVRSDRSIADLHYTLKIAFE